jgi:UrcA family protein
MNTRQFIAICAAAISLAGGASAQTIHVTDTDSQRSVKVSYGDLDLAHAQGAQVLIDRVRQASQIACGESPSLANLEQTQAYRSCVVSTADQAIASVGEPMVTAMYQNTARPQLLAAR